ncbi:MAG TPA: agmatinase family protein [Chloroflexota bacterium]|nr:agmatinase family protein [Chloroflexota bacterium]
MPAEDLPGLFAPAWTFAALPPELCAYGTARAVVLPVPYDATTTFRGGTRDGPRAIIGASRELELYDIELGREPAALGIHTCPELEPHLGDPAQMVERVRLAVAGLLGDGKLPIMLGGEHTLTAGSVAACAAAWPDLALLYLDAHADMRGPYLGATHNHASALRLSLEHLDRPQRTPSRVERAERATREGAPRDGGGPASRVPGQETADSERRREAPPAVLVGVRSMASEEAAAIATSGLHVVGADRVAATRRSGQAAVERLWQETVDRLGPPGRPLYVSIDLDVFDPGVLPAVGTPEPGGLEWYEVLALLREAARRFRVVMADVMELAPAEGPLASTFTAAKLAYKVIGYSLASDP